MIVVTGATGHIGNNLVRELTKYDEAVRAMVLPGESLIPLEGLPVEIVWGDVRKPDTLSQAMEGARIVYHLASVISLLPGRDELLEEVNVKGARNVAECCLRVGVKRLVYTSSIHALIEPPHGIPIDESVGVDPDRVRLAYSKSKAKGALEVMKVTKRGLDAVILYPTGVIGPYDYRPSDTGQMILDFAAGLLPATTDGGYDFVDVRDVARGHILAASRGRAGEGYILSGEWISVRDVLSRVSELVGRPLPRLHVSPRTAMVAARFFMWLSGITGRRPMVNVDMVETLLGNSEIVTTKAEQELGYSSRPIGESIGDLVHWMMDSGMLQGPRGNLS